VIFCLQTTHIRLLSNPLQANIQSGFRFGGTTTEASMDLVGQILSGIGGLGALICFILVLVKMFQNGATGLAIACIVLAFCCGIGALIAFIYGWIKSGEWNLRNVMLVWTVCIVLSVIGNAMNPAQFTAGIEHFRGMQGK
jgi:hypothetical protein